MSNTSAAFRAIYREHKWGGTSRSGPGSDPHLLRPYLRLVSKFIRNNGVRSVVDIGCGDWALARTMDWSGVDYTGIDVVPELVDRLNETYGSENIKFICADVTLDDPPAADLCLIKDMLQHLANEKVSIILNKLPHYFKYAIITNDLTHDQIGGWRNLWRKVGGLQPNCDTPNGGYRPLRLADAPFHLRATRLALIPLRFKRTIQGHPGTVLETKEVLLWKQRSEE